MTDLEEAIQQQKDEYEETIARFRRAWLEETPLPFKRVLANGSSSVGPLPLLTLSRSEIDVSIAEVRKSIDAINDEVESDLKLFKSRWEVTADRLETLPANISKINSLTAARRYVADTIFAGDVPALLTERSRIYQDRTRQILNTTTDPLGLRRAAATPTEEEALLNPVLNPTDASNLRLPGRHIAIVTTAALPWMTGTSINPLLRAAYLSKLGYNVTLVVPWIPPEQQVQLYPEGLIFDRRALQEQYIRFWLENRASVDSPALKIRWFPARFEPVLGCIIPDIDDITSALPPHEQDVVILEEPEHLNWYHHGRKWTDVYSHVVGIAHTNYLKYARENNEGVVQSGVIKEWFVKNLNELVCSYNTDIVVKLSATLPDVPGENLVCNVHGVVRTRGLPQRRVAFPSGVWPSPAACGLPLEASVAPCARPAGRGALPARGLAHPSCCSSL